MPPAISDEESGSEGVPDAFPAMVQAPAAEKEDDEEEEDEGEEDEYRVEKILKHGFSDDGAVQYQIKWLGYEDPEDMTWEPVENLEGAVDVLKAYHKKIGGAPEPLPKSNKKGSKGKRSASAAFDSPAPASSTKKKGGRKSNGAQDEEVGKRNLPLGSWDNDVRRVTSIIEETVEGAKAGRDEKELIGLLEWKDGAPKTQHKMKVLRQKVPQRLLDYYEQHLS
ncbi:hypothetical protein B0A50_04274 [Salinomyces thailandicus]|uniref:Chromo domain-containing protein n=1 Tax=Salinomyces thailandicus TaxID=706561 RepID=A0A4U0TWS5_9PEZI|nr:hypothetical protein B0A50_04274 [Salinomyces thailandica]